MEVHWKKVENDQVGPISSYSGSNDEKMKEAFNWRSTQPLRKSIHCQKGTKFDFVGYRLQFFKAYQLWKKKKRFSTSIFVDEKNNKAPAKDYETNNLVFNRIDQIWGTDPMDMSDYKGSNKEFFG